MCGIHGLWHLDGRPADLARLRAAATAMRHRGPDDEGYLLADTRARRLVTCGGSDTDQRLALPEMEAFSGERFDLAFAHRRLSILDLSPAGHQPMASADGDLWIAYNGEVYNYLELRDELRAAGHVFSTGTDTEVLLAAYRAWGADCLSRFNGMWAFALWDAANDTLFCARDRFGIKPFYYYWDGTTFVFASEPKALLEHPAVPKRPNTGVIYDYVSLKQEDHTDETFFEGIVKLPPGHLLELNRGGLQMRKWWSPAVNLELGESDEHRSREVQDRFLELLTDAVRIRLRSDVALGTCLSGGIDSSTIVCLANRLILQEGAVDPALVGDRQKTFSARCRNSRADEGQYMRLVTEVTGAAAHEVYPGSDVALWEELEKLTWHQDEPFGSTSIFAQWNVMRLAAQNGVTVLLDGQGADEVLAGYHRYYGAHLAQLWRECGAAAARQAARQSGASSDRSAALLLGWGLRDCFRGTARPRVRKVVNRFGSRPLPWVSREFARQHRERGPQLRDSLTSATLASALYTDLTRLCLPALLRYEDRNSMAFSREARVPFLDYRLVEYVFSLPACYRLGDGWTKWLLREATAEIVPDDIRWRKRKIAFATPESDWLREGEGFLRDLLSGEPRSSQFVDIGRLRNTKPLASQPGLWRWVNLEVWLRTFFG